jgi:hypothetical protein
MIRAEITGHGISRIGFSGHRKIGKVCGYFFLEFSGRARHIA